MIANSGMACSVAMEARASWMVRGGGVLVFVVPVSHRGPGSRGRFQADAVLDSCLQSRAGT